MKIRIAIAALMVASLAAFGLSRSASAATCTAIDSESGEREATACTSQVTVDALVGRGGSLLVTPLPADTLVPDAPRVNFLGDAVTVAAWNSSGASIAATQIEICFADPTASGNVYWWNAVSGAWQYIPSFHLAGMDCGSAFGMGTFTRN